MTTKTFSAVGALALTLLAMPHAAVADPISWVFTSSGCTTSGTTDGNTRTCGAASPGGATVTASAWANTKGSTNTQLENALLEVFSGGLGVRNRDRAAGDVNEAGTPQHAMDNINRYDSLLLAFSSPVTLTQMSIGYFSGDSDVSVLAYVGAGIPTLSDATYGALTSSGWSLVGHYADLLVGSPRVINAEGISSMYWLVGAYNPTVGGGAGLSVGNDAVKLYSVSATQPVPEPATSALLLTGLVLIIAGGRRWRNLPHGA